jgi:hypothetical protein
VATGGDAFHLNDVSYCFWPVSSPPPLAHQNECDDDATAHVHRMVSTSCPFVAVAVADTVDEI